MTAPRAQALACPQCGGPLRGVLSSTFLDCPACASPLAVLVEDAPLREAIAPSVDREQAVAAVRASWEGRAVPKTFLVGDAVEALLLFVPFREVARTALVKEGGGATLVGHLSLAPAADPPDVPLARFDALGAIGRGTRESFDAASLQRRAVVLDPDEVVRDGGKGPPGEVVEERTTLVWLPLWLVRGRHDRNLYEAVVDATSGVVFSGRAPMERTARLHEVVLLVYLFAFVLSMPLSWWWRVIAFLFDLHFAAGIVGTIGLPGVVVWILAFAWDRLRFRTEWVREGGDVRSQAVNRPPRTLPERVRDGFFSTARSVAQVLE